MRGCTASVSWDARSACWRQTRAAPPGHSLGIFTVRFRRCDVDHGVGWVGLFVYVAKTVSPVKLPHLLRKRIHTRTQSIMFNTTALLSSLITANHILSYHNVLDPFGHVSVRNPLTNTTFFIALQLGKSCFCSSRVHVNTDRRDCRSSSSLRARGHWRVPHLRRNAGKRYRGRIL